MNCPHCGKPMPSKVETIDHDDYRFVQFWRAYPRKVAKPVAMKAFAKALQGGTSLVTILAALDRHKRSPQWIKDNGQFIPHPATWLNQERWNDVVEMPQSQPCIQSGGSPMHQAGNF